MDRGTGTSLAYLALSLALTTLAASAGPGGSWAGDPVPGRPGGAPAAGGWGSANLLGWARQKCGGTLRVLQGALTA